MPSNKHISYRVVKYPTGYCVMPIEHDASGNPVSVVSDDSELYNTVEELSHAMIHKMAALTLPIVEAAAVDANFVNVSETSHQAFNLLGKKNV
jgi:hypothetical protein